MRRAGERRSAQRLLLVACAAATLFGATPVASARVALTRGAWPLPSASSEAGPPVIVVTPESSRFELGTASSIPIRIVLSGEGASGARIADAAVNVGSIDLPAGPAGSTTHLARYTVPEERFPQVALIVVQAVFPDGRQIAGSSVIWLTARTEIPFRTTPYAPVTLEIAGVQFGPRVADGEGRVRLPVVVPPGVAQGLARATDRFGGTTETTVNLQPKDYPRTVVIAPSEGEAGSTVDVAVWGVTPTGGPAAPEQLELESSTGKVTRKIGGNGASGMAVFAVKLHQDTRAGAVAIKGRISDSEADQPDAITVHAGPAAAIELSSDSAHLVIGSDEAATVSIQVLDRFGNSSGSTGRPVVTVDGETIPTVGAEGAELTISVAAPVRWDGRDHREIEAALGSVRGKLRLPVIGGPASHLTVVALRNRLRGDGTDAAVVHASVADADGVPTRVRQLLWEASAGVLEPLGSPRPGLYVARFVPNRARRNATVAIRATSAEDQLAAATEIAVDSSAKHWVAVHAGLAWNLGALFGPALLIDATRSVLHLGDSGRKLAVGLALGYLPSRFSATADDSAPTGLAGAVEIDRFPMLGVARIEIPLPSAAQLAVAAHGGVSYASSRVGATDIMSRSTSFGLALGASVESALPIGDGALIVGLRYLGLDLRSRGNADRIEGNTGGVVLDVGYGAAF